jgi:hypothetical protein
VTHEDEDTHGTEGTLCAMRFLPMTAASAVLLLAGGAHAQKVEELDPHVKVTAAASSITLEWQAAPDTTSWSLRKREGDGAWTTLEAMLPATTLSYEDKTVTAGKVVEYNVQRKGTTSGNAYVLAGFEVPFPDDPGVVALVVDEQTAKVTSVLEEDLAREGWDVEKVVVTATDKPETLRDKLKELKTKHAARFAAAFLLGRVPRAFSGSINPDGHPDHKGAWPADTFYGDLDGMWPDTQELGGEGVFVNKAGDGKFDPSRLPSDVDIAVGRVDFFEMPAFAPLDEQALIKRYLEADHAFRAGQKTYGARTFVADSFGYFSGEAFSRLAWRDAHAIYGSGPESGKPIFDALEDPAGYGLAFGCGGGNPTGAGGVGSTNDFVMRAPRAAFFGLFGSYFGDWSYKDNFLRAALGSSGGVLATAWFARPWHHLHHLGAMRTFGQAFVATANNSGVAYDTGSSARSIHLALLGDPTLRLFVARAPTELKAGSATTALRLDWAASPDADSGYVVYRRDGKGTPWKKLADVAALTYDDATVVDGSSYEYRVVARKKKVTASGSFFLHSPGGTVVAKYTALTGIDGDSGLESDGGVAADPGAMPEDSGCGCHIPARTANGSWLLVGLMLMRWRRGRR